MNYRVSITVEVPDGISEEDFRSWIRYELGIDSTLSLQNPLSDGDLAGAAFSNVVDIRKED